METRMHSSEMHTARSSSRPGVVGGVHQAPQGAGTPLPEAGTPASRHPPPGAGNPLAAGSPPDQAPLWTDTRL